jgi:Uma2 family endonuclease
MAVATTGLLTAEEFAEWLQQPENAGRRCELVHGRIIDMPSPTRFHGTVCALTTRILGNYIFARGAGSIASNDSALIVRRNPDTVRGPDLMLFLPIIALDDIPRRPSEEVPALVVEVLSPSDTQTRTLLRVQQYHARGVPLVWVIDPEERTVHVYYPNEFPKVLDETEALTGNGVLPDFACKVAELFALPGPAAA